MKWIGSIFHHLSGGLSKVWTGNFARLCGSKINIHSSLEIHNAGSIAFNYCLEPEEANKLLLSDKSSR